MDKWAAMGLSIAFRACFVLLLIFSTELLASWEQTSADYGLTWYSSSVSVDGQHLAAAVYQGGIYVSPDFGSNWYLSGAPSITWTSIACNSTGQQIVAVAYNAGVYISRDYGTTFSLVLSQNVYWFSTSSDCTGSTLLALVYNGAAYISRDSGNTWNSIPSLPSSSASSTWYSSFVSCTGQVLAAVINNGPDAGIYVSTNSGVSWSKSQSGVSGWTAIAGSSSGQYLVATLYMGQIYTSSDFGATWTTVTESVTGSWISVTSDSTGKYLAAAVLGGQLYQSVDYGVSWSIMYSEATAGSLQWRSVRCDGSAEVCVAVAQNQGVYVGNITALDSSLAPTATPTRPTAVPSARPTSTPSAAPSTHSKHDTTVYQTVILVLVSIFMLCVTYICFCNCRNMVNIFCPCVDGYRNGDGNRDNEVTAEFVLVDTTLEYSSVPVSTNVIVVTEGFDNEEDNLEMGARSVSAFSGENGTVESSVGGGFRRNAGVIRVEGEEHHVVQAFRLN